jgi:hypothetical protein
MVLNSGNFQIFFQFGLLNSTEKLCFQNLERNYFLVVVTEASLKFFKVQMDIFSIPSYVIIGANTAEAALQKLITLTKC